MPHSPYRKTVYPPIQDVDEYRRELIQHRANWECGERDKYLADSLLEIGETLVEHCEFLETKLVIKVRIYLISGTLSTSMNKIADGACMRFT